MKMFTRLAAVILVFLLLAGASLHASAGSFSPLRAEEDEVSVPEAEAEQDNPLVTLRGRNMVSDGTYVYYIPQEPTYSYTDYFGIYPEDYEDELPEMQTLRRAALPFTEHPLDTEEVLYEGKCEWLSIGSDGRIYFCSYDETALMSYDPETEETELVYASPEGYPPSLPYYRDGYLFFVEAGDLMCWECGSEEDAELYFSAWDYSMAAGDEDETYSFLWEVYDYEFVGDTLYINLSNTDADYVPVYRLIAGPASYDDYNSEPEGGEEAETGDGESGGRGARSFLSGLIGSKDKGEEETPQEDEPEDTAPEDAEDDVPLDGDGYLSAYGFRLVARQNGGNIARYQDKLIFINTIETGDPEAPFTRDDYGDYVFRISEVDEAGNIRAFSPILDTRTMFVAGDEVYYDGYLDNDDTYGTKDGEPLQGRFIFRQNLSDPEDESADAQLFSLIDNPQRIIGVAGGWLWYFSYENNFWVDLEDIDQCYWMSYLDEEGDIEIEGDGDEQDSPDDGDEGEEQGGFVPPENIPGDTGVYGPGTCDLRLDSGDQMAAFRLVRTDGTEEFFVILNAYSTQTVTFPCGTYILKTAEGPQWISDEEAFGEDGIYSTTDWYVFEADYEYFIETSGTNGDFDGDTKNGFLN